MNPKTRDNVIYLSVGLSLAALVAAEAFYGVSRGREMWLPSTFAFRAVASTGLLAICVAKLMRKLEANLVQLVATVLLASMLHVGIIFEFRQAVGQLPGISFDPVVILEMFVVGVLSERAVLYLLPSKGKRPTRE